MNLSTLFDRGKITLKFKHHCLEFNNFRSDTDRFVVFVVRVKRMLIYLPKLFSFGRCLILDECYTKSFAILVSIENLSA